MNYNCMTSRLWGLLATACLICSQVVGQNIAVMSTPLGGEVIKEIGSFNRQGCEIVPMGLNTDSLNVQSIVYNENGELFLYSLENDNTLYKLNETTGGIDSIANLGPPPRWRDLTFFNDSLLYATRTIDDLIPTSRFGVFNIKTSAWTLAPVEYDSLGGWGLTVREDKPYLYRPGEGIYLINIENYADFELVVPMMDFFELFFEDIATVRYSCDSTVTYGFGRSIAENGGATTKLYIVDFENQDVIDTGCETERIVYSSTSRRELGIPPCELSVSLSRAVFPDPDLFYTADTSCGQSPVPVSAPDGYLVAQLGYVDSVSFELGNLLDGPAEQLLFPGADSIEAMGSGSGRLQLRAVGRPGLAAWEEALRSVRYVNSAAPEPQAGLRRVAIVAYMGGYASDTAFAFLPIYNTVPSAGEDGSLALCPGGGPVELFSALGGQPAPGGQWAPGSGSFDPAVDAPGEYLYVQALPGCPADTTRLMVSLADTLDLGLPSDTVLCQGGSLLLQGPSGLAVYTWSDGSSGGSLLASAPGTYWLQAQDSLGCLYSDTVAVGLSSFEGLAFEVVDVRCYGGSDGSLSVLPQGGQPPYAYEWADGSTGSLLAGLPAGTYEVTVTDATGCAQTGSAVLVQPGAPISQEDSLVLCAGQAYEWQGQPISVDTLLQAVYTSSTGCDSTYALSLSFSSPAAVLDTAAVCAGQAYEWQGLQLAQDTSLCLTYTSADGCDSLHCLELSVLPAPVVELPGLSQLCAGAALLLDGGEHAGYLWSDGSQQRYLEVSAPGTYSLTVTGAGGCTAEAAAQVAQAPPVRLSLGLTAPACTGQVNGTISAEAVSGGTPPYRFSLNGGALQPEGVFQNLPAGDYLISVQDSLGCQSDTLAVLDGPLPLQADAGGGQSIKQGQSVLLQGSTNAAQYSVQWLPPDGLDCDTCLSTIARPEQSQTYLLTVTDAKGCTASSEVRISVERPLGFGVPNAFSPNGDGRNDTFAPLPAVPGLRAEHFQVFNRWGGLTHERRSLLLEDAGLAWDGGRSPTGLYVWLLVVEWPDGRIEHAHGEVLLLR